MKVLVEDVVVEKKPHHKRSKNIEAPLETLWEHPEHIFSPEDNRPRINGVFKNPKRYKNNIYISLYDDHPREFHDFPGGLVLCRYIWVRQNNLLTLY